MAELGTVNEVVGSNVWEELEVRLPKDLEAAAKLMKETAKTFKDNALSFSFSGNLKQEIENTKELIRIQQNLAQTYRDSARAEQEAARTRQANANAIAAEERANQAAIRTRQAATREQNANNQATQRSIQANSMHATSLAALSRNLEGLRRGYNLLTEEERKNADIGGVLLARIRELDIQLKASDASMGRYNRNVGNYAGGFNGLNMAIQQIIREGPSAAISLNTFFLAISNNLPILFDEIGKIRTLTKETKATGEAAYNAAYQKAIAANQTNAQAKAAGKLAAALAIATEEEIAAANAARFQAEASAAAAGATEAQAKAAGDLAAIQSLTNAQSARMPSLWAQISKSIFSANTFLTLAVLGLTLFGSKIVEFGKSLFGVRDSINQIESATKIASKANEDYAKSIKSVENNSKDAAFRDIARINVLSQVASSEDQTHRARMRAIKELQETYPATFGNLSKQALLEGELKNAIDLTTQALLSRAAYEAAQEKFGIAARKEYELSRAQTQAYKDLAEAQKTAAKYANVQPRYVADIDVSGKAAADRAATTAQNTLQGIISDRLRAQEEMKSFLSDAQKFAAQAGDVLFGKDQKTHVKATKDEVNEIVAALKGQNDAERDLEVARAQRSADTNRQIFENDKLNAEERLIGFSQFYEAQTKIIYLNQEKQLQDIKAFEDQYKTEYEKALATETSARTEHQKALIILWDTNAKRRIAIEEDTATQLGDLQIKAIDEINKTEIDGKKIKDQIGEEGLKNAKRWRDTLDQYEKDHTKTVKKNAKERKAEYDSYFSIASSALSAISGILDGQNQRSQQETEAKKEAIDEEYDRRISLIKSSGQTQAEIDKEVADQEIRRAADKKQADDEQAKRDARNAKFQKQIAIAAIILNTARSVTAALTSLPPNVPLAIANAIEGAAQLSVALATPVPKYAKGTQNHRGGPFIGGDGGEPEWVQPKGKNGYWTPSVSTFFNEPAGTTVTPLSKIKAAAHQQAIIGVGNNTITPELYASHFIGSFEKLTGKMDDVNRTIKSKPTILITGTDKGISAVGRKSNAFTQYLNKNIYQ